MKLSKRAILAISIAVVAIAVFVVVNNAVLSWG